MASTAFLQQAYLAYFGRPADPSGLAYYSEKTEAQVKAAFSASPESQAFFGSLEINAQINTIYQNLFNRDAEPAGLAYWSKEIGAGRLSLADAAMGILAGAQNADKTAVANKLAASAAFTAALDTTAEILGYAGAASIAPARAYLQAVDSSAASLTAATAGVDASIAGVVAAGAVSQGQTFVLTTGVDGGAAFTGTAKNDIFNAALVNSVNSLNSLDSLTGGAGSDTLNVELASSVTPAGIAGIEIINTTFSAGGLALNLVNAPDVTTVTSRSSANSGTVSNIAAGASVGITDQAVGATFAYKTTEGTQTVGLALNNVTSNAAITISGIETINVTSGTSANSMALAADSVTTLNVSGSANLTLSNVASGSASLTKLDASALTGSLDMGAAGPAGLVTINGGSGNDSLYGTSSVNNNLNAGAGNDTIVMAGNLTSADTINGGNGTDVLSMTAGGAADSVFTNVSNVETLTLSTGGTITLGAKAQAAGIVTINGSTVADTISATAYTVGITYTEGADSSADSIALGSGNDVFVFGGTLQLSGNDTLDGNGGTDVIRLDNSAGAVSAIVDLDLVTDIEQIVVFDADGTTNGVTGTAQNIDLTLAAVTSTAGAVGVSSIVIDASVITDASDALIMTNSMATAGLTLSITGGAGNDVLAGASGADTISGGAGNDSIDGNSGNDVLSGNAGNDTITGGVGNDTITGGTGNDSLNGQTGNDVISGDAGNDNITAGTGNDSLSGGDGNDTFVLADNLTLDDSIDGGLGSDILTVNGTIADSAFLFVSGVETITADGGSNNWTLGARAQNAGIVNINGSTTADVISATAYTVGIVYTEGAASSADSIALGAGNDVFVFSGTLQLSGNDTLDGNGGTDVIRLDNSSGSVSAIVDFDLVTDIEQIVVFDADGTTNGTTDTTQNITLTLNAVTSTSGVVGVSNIVIDASVITDASDALIMTNNMATAGFTMSITGGAGNDVLAGASGADTISGGAGADSIDGNSGNDVLSGDAGNDTITGAAGNDTISGGAGNDSLNGGSGMDSLTGGAGADTFNVSDASTTKFSYDVITDLTLADDDVVVFADTALTESFVSTGISLGGAATFTDYLNQAASLSDAVNSVISWFQFNGNTYLVQDCSSGAATFVDGTDIVVEITGLVTLSGATLSGQSLTV